MSKSSSSDDLNSLASQAGFNPAAYKTFQNTRIKPAEAKEEPASSPSPQFAQLSEPDRKENVPAFAPAVNTSYRSINTEPPESRRLGSPIETVEKSFRADARFARAADAIGTYPETSLPLKNLVQFSKWGRWTGLDVVLSDSSHGIASNSIEPQLRRIPAVSVSGVASGIGTSTVVASLARLYARRGEQVVLLDVSTDTLMPLFFGGRSSTAPIASFVFSGDPRRGSVHTCRRDENDLREPTEGSISRWLESVTGESDQFIVDGGINRYCRPSHKRVGSSLELLVLVPDTRCLAALRRVEDSSIDARTGGLSSPFLLLNQFDGSDTLHTEIRARLLNRFPERLIPIQIRRDRQIPAALAEGMTVVDYAPESNAVEDLVRLDQWLRSRQVEEPAGDLSQKVQVL